MWYVVTNINHFSVDKRKKYCNWTCEDMIYAINFLQDKFFVHVDNKVFHQIAGILMGTNHTPLIVDLFLYRYES